MVVVVFENGNKHFFQLHCIVAPTNAGGSTEDLWPVSVTQFLFQEINEICDITSQFLSGLNSLGFNWHSLAWGFACVLMSPYEHILTTSPY